VISGAENTAYERLLNALAEQLKIPLLQIARTAELGTDNPKVDDLRTITSTADMALQLIDGYLLYGSLHNQTTLELEPVSISALLQNTAHYLTPFAKRLGCTVTIHLSGKYGPVMAHRGALDAAFKALGYSLIEASATKSTSTILLAAHRSSRGLVAGIYGTGQTFTGDSLRRGKALFGTAAQPASELSSTSGAGIFVANALLESMSSPLHTSHHHKLSGLAATLLPSRQLQLVTS